jgi:hypothetical protein
VADSHRGIGFCALTSGRARIRQAAMYSYPAVHSAVPGWLLTVISIALIAYSAAGELLWQHWRGVLPSRAQALMVASVIVDACEAVSWSIFMTMWLKRCVTRALRAHPAVVRAADAVAAAAGTRACRGPTSRPRAAASPRPTARASCALRRTVRCALYVLMHAVPLCAC